MANPFNGAMLRTLIINKLVDMNPHGALYNSTYEDMTDAQLWKLYNQMVYYKVSSLAYKALGELLT